MAARFLRGAASRTMRYTRPMIIGTIHIWCLTGVFGDSIGEIRESMGSSMLPTFAAQGDYLLLVRLPLYRLLSSWFPRQSSDNLVIPPYVGGPKGKLDPSMGTGLRMGDLVVVASPRDPSKIVCKRILGLPGDTILVDPRIDAPSDHAEAWVGSSARRRTLREVKEQKDDGEARAAPSSSSSSPKKSEDAILQPQPRYTTVPRGHVWLGGDNLGNSVDSRTYGPVPFGLVQGIIVARVWPSLTWFGNDVRPAE